MSLGEVPVTLLVVVDEEAIRNAMRTGTAIDPAIHEALEAVVSRRQALVFLDDPLR